MVSLAASLIGGQLAEDARASAAGGDDKYLRNMTYFFEMKVPKSISKLPGSFLYPLILNPDEYRMSEPFTVEKTFTTGSGLFVEENGVIAREITISGNTGWRPRKLPNIVSLSSSQLGDLPAPPGGRSHSRNIQFNAIVALSGQRHFQFLQDVVLRAYGDLKRDPTTNPDTALFFHNTKMDESWRVIPLSFDLEQRAPSLLTRYTIRLLAVEGASQTQALFSPDQDVLTALKNADIMLHSAVGEVNAALLNVSGIQGAVRTSLQGIGTILDNVADIAKAVDDFLAGTAGFIPAGGAVIASAISFGPTLARTAINIPYEFVQATMEAQEIVFQAYEDAVLLGAPETVPGSVLNQLRRMHDAMHVIASYPDSFETSLEVDIANHQRRAELSLSSSGEAPAIPQLMRDLDSGTHLPGDETRRATELGLGRNTPKYTSAFEVIIESGDTLTNLASKYLGDPKRWKYIALLNDLQHPYISALSLPFTLGVGDRILIPSTDQPQRTAANFVTLGVLPDALLEDQVLGTDYLLVERKEEPGRYGWSVDVEGGSVDVKKVSGVANLQQGLGVRMRTELGTDVLYRDLGVQRVVGVGLTAVDRATVQLRVSSAIQADPRVAVVSRISSENGQNGASSDVLLIDADVEVRGLNRSEKIRQRV